MGHLEKFSLFKFVVRNPSASSKILATLVPVFFIIITSLVFPDLSKLLFLKVASV